METKKKAAVAAIKKTLSKNIKPKAVPGKKTREEIEKMFALDFSCDCSHCSHHCGDAE